MFRFGIEHGRELNENEWSLELETGVNAYASRRSFGASWQIGYED